jgi:hypothetical protein
MNHTGNDARRRDRAANDNARVDAESQPASAVRLRVVTSGRGADGTVLRGCAKETSEPCLTSSPYRGT